MKKPFADTRSGQIILAKNRRHRDKVKDLAVLFIDVCREHPKFTKWFFIILLLGLASINYDRIFGWLKPVLGFVSPEGSVPDGD